MNLGLLYLLLPLPVTATEKGRDLRFMEILSGEICWEFWGISMA